MFLVFPWLLTKCGFWPALGISAVGTILVFFIFAWLAKPFGVDLLP
ncbi:hypothetical protein [Pseudoalteromonas tunicata]|jgi:dipeptide/tripeptide permease|uniref:Uncharacterized protein n=1 Tax=Pseudoalteromonas tunicata D2 TaxID=87626 RepID=A4C3A6_9GAMM|nr:hypothetical protein [Pseudoalteromonas tunicata]ATC96680.1 hypothetical protein PTUN_b0261 [Pseudoalteromonas tunicata]EAR30038.1 hypothetical protein PTD2_00676 [Pseudoalteromonas tunicata D2]